MPSLFGMRIPIGECGVIAITSWLLVFSASIFFSTSSRLPLIVFTRKSRLACSNILRQMVSASTSPYCATSLVHSQSRTSACTDNGKFSVLLALIACAHSVCCSFKIDSSSRMLLPSTRNNQANISLRASSGSPSWLAVTVLKKRKRRSTPYTLSATNARSFVPKSRLLRKNSLNLASAGLLNSSMLVSIMAV